MIPENSIIEDQLEVSTMASRTWRLNAKTQRIEEVIEDKEAVKQAIDNILDTPRYEELVLPESYGHELWTLIGHELYFIESEAPRMIKEALMVDDRITDVKDFLFIEGEEEDELTIRFTVVSIFGDIEAEMMLER